MTGDEIEPRNGNFSTGDFLGEKFKDCRRLVNTVFFYESHCACGFGGDDFGFCF